MEIRVIGEPKEIADLIAALQDQPLLNLGVDMGVDVDKIASGVKQAVASATHDIGKSSTQSGGVPK